MNLNAKNELCYDCVCLDTTCDGRRLYVRNRKSAVKRCVNMDSGEDPNPSPIQVHAFMSLYGAKRRYGMALCQAFAEAIVQTSDDVYKKLKSKNRELIRSYEKRKKDKDWTAISTN